MEAGNERNRGLSMIGVGLAVVVLAVLLFGLTTDSGDPDWISIITAVAGAVWAGAGLFVTFHHKGTGAAPTGHTPGRGILS